MGIRCLRVASALLVTSLATVFAACGSSSGLPAATFENTEDTVALYALDGTALSLPSGFSVANDERLRTDRSSNFDFAFNITPAGEAVLLPTGALGLGIASGIAIQTVPFDSVMAAPTSGYVDTSAVRVDSGSVAVVRSRPTQCGFGLVVSYYGKLQVIRIDPVERRIDFRILVDQNCGYRGLAPGIPSR